MNQDYNYYNMPMIPEVFLEVLDVRNRSSCVRYPILVQNVTGSNLCRRPAVL